MEREQPEAIVSLDRGLVLLQAVVETGPARADELAAASGIPLSTAYRYLRTLRARRFVAESDGLYAPGPVMQPASLIRIGRAELVATADPVLRRLARDSGETAVLAVRTGLHAVCVHQIESSHAIRLAFSVGEALPLYAGAGQRTLLAHAPDEVVEAVMSGAFERFTPNTPTPENLRKRLESTRLSGIATSRSEYSPGGVAIAAPVFCDGRIVCSMTIAGPDSRCGPAWQSQVRPSLEVQSRLLGETLAAIAADRAAAARPAVHSHETPAELLGSV